MTMICVSRMLIDVRKFSQMMLFEGAGWAVWFVG